MALIMHTENGTINVSGGVGSANITANNNMLVHVFVKAATLVTEFDITLTDIYDNVTFTREDETGEINEFINIPAYGNWTLDILNSDADEAFEYMLVFRES